MSATLDDLLSRDILWRPGKRRVPARTGLPTGFASLNAVLRESGWPRGALVELLAAQPGTGELRLILPVLGSLSASGLYQLWIDPPFQAFAPGLLPRGIDLRQLVIVRSTDRPQWLWAAEQALRSPGCGAVVAWAGAGRARYAELRKLQVAAAERQCVGFLFSHPRHADGDGLAVEVLKQRGSAAGERIVLETPRSLARQRPLRERAAIVSTPERLPLPPKPAQLPSAQVLRLWQ
jgi:protein ImuA